MDKAVPFIVSCTLPTHDSVFCDVTVEPYCLCRRGDTPISIDELPEEGSPDGTYQLRTKWYRHTVPRGGAYCSVHPEREATLQCRVCLKLGVAQHLSFHCSTDCLRAHWHAHKAYHKAVSLAQANGALRELLKWQALAHSHNWPPPPHGPCRQRRARGREWQAAQRGRLVGGGAFRR